MFPHKYRYLSVILINHSIDLSGDDLFLLFQSDARARACHVFLHITYLIKSDGFDENLLGTVKRLEVSIEVVTLQSSPTIGRRPDLDWVRRHDQSRGAEAEHHDDVADNRQRADRVLREENAHAHERLRHPFAERLAPRVRPLVLRAAVRIVLDVAPTCECFH